MAIETRQLRNGKKSFVVRVRDNQGKWFPILSFSEFKEAQREELRLLDLKKKGAKSITQDAKAVTLDEYWEVWSQENRGKVSEGWKISENQMYRDYIKPVLGDLTLYEIGIPEVGKVMNAVKNKGRSDQTCKHVYTLIRKMFGAAVEYYEMLAINPVKPKFHRPNVKDQSRKFHTPDEAFRLLEAVKDHYLGPAIWLQMLAGLRVSEVQGLVGKCLLFDLDQILICRVFNNKTSQMQEFPKQGDWAYAVMPPMLKEYLRAMKIGPEEFAAPGPKGRNQMLSYETYHRALKRLCRREGLPILDTHELRHSCTEIFVQHGASAEDVRRLLNQKSLTATKKYIHRTDGRLKGIAGSIGVNHLRLVSS